MGQKLGCHHNLQLSKSSSYFTFTRPTPESILGRTLRSKYSPTVGTAILDCNHEDDNDDDDDDNDEEDDDDINSFNVMAEHMSWA